MRTTSNYRLSALLQLSAVFLTATPCLAAWQSNAPFGSTLQGDLFSPSKPGEAPAVLVAIHYCTGNKSVVHSWFESAAEKNGFYIIAPDAGKQCFDSSIGRKGDPAAIVKMVDYVVTEKGADKSRVFAAGLSSGGCMTNTLLAVYPDVFAGGAAMPGFPAGAWPSGDTTCTKCSSSPSSSDGKYWADMARNVFSWSGTRPCVQQWVGGGDEYNFNGWLPAVAAQFQNLGDLEAGSQGTGAPSGWTRTIYKDKSGNVRLETNLGPASQKHDLSSANLFGQVVTFLGLDKPTGACGLADSGTGGTGGAGGAGSTTAATTAKSTTAAGGAGGTGSKASSGTGGAATSSSKAASSSGTGGSPTSKAATTKAGQGGSSSKDSDTSNGGSADSGDGEEGGSDPQSAKGGSKGTTKTTAGKGGSKANSTTNAAETTSTPATGTNDAGASDSGCGIVGANTRTPGAAAWFSLLAGLVLASRRRRRS